MGTDTTTSLQVCTDSIAAELLAALLRSQSIPAWVRDQGALSGLPGRRRT